MSIFPPVPPPTPAAIQLLRNLPALADSTGDRVSVVLDATLPALRVSLVGYSGPAATDWEAAPMYQVEIWAADVMDAERIAWDLANNWTHSGQEAVPGGVVHGRWLTQHPIELPASDDEAEDTGLARYMVTVAFRLTGVTHG